VFGQAIAEPKPLLAEDVFKNAIGGIKFPFKITFSWLDGSGRI